MSFCVFGDFFRFSKEMGFGVFLVHPSMALVLLSKSVERCFVSRMRDFLLRTDNYWLSDYRKFLLSPQTEGGWSDKFALAVQCTPHKWVGSDNKKWHVHLEIMLIFGNMFVISLSEMLCTNSTCVLNSTGSVHPDIVYIYYSLQID